MLAIPGGVLEEARAFFEHRGASGCEGTAMLAGVTNGVDGEVKRLVIPDQIASPYPDCWVAVTPNGKLELAAALAPNERYLARIHSHPGDAFHSPTDEENLGLTADGAISIVVPFFGLGLRVGLQSCAVYAMRGAEWIPVEHGEALRLT